MKSHQRTAGRREASSAPVLGTITAAFLCLIVPIGFISTTGDNPLDGWVWCLGIAVVAGLRFSWVVASGARHPFEMATWLYFYLFLGIAAMVQLRTATDPGTTPNIDHDFDFRAAIMVLLSAAAIMVGSIVGKRTIDIADTRTARRVLVSSRVTVFSLAIFALTAYYIASVGVGTLVSSRTDRSIATSVSLGGAATTALVSSAVTMGLLVSAVAQILLLRQRKNHGEKGPIPMLAFTLGVLLLCTNPISSPRYVVGTVVMGLAAALGAYATVPRFRAVAIGVLSGFLIIFPLLGTFRRSLDTALTLVNPTTSLLSGDYDSFAQINNTVLYVERFGSTWGDQALAVLLFWVPRSIWSGKASDTGILLAQSRDYGFTNLSAPLPAELFINGGWLAVVLGMLIFGYILRRLDTSVERELRFSGVPTLIGCAVPFYLLLVLRGSLLQATGALIVIILGNWWVHRDQAPRGAPEPNK